MESCPDRFRWLDSEQEVETLSSWLKYASLFYIIPHMFILWSSTCQICASLAKCLFWPTLSAKASQRQHLEATGKLTVDWNQCRTGLAIFLFDLIGSKWSASKRMECLFSSSTGSAERKAESDVVNIKYIHISRLRK